MKNFKLVEARRKSGLTQEEAALRAEISTSSYRRIEYGTQRPNIDTAFRIADALDSTVEELFRKT